MAATVNPRRFDPYKNFRFRVKLDGTYVAGLARVTPKARREDLSLTGAAKRTFGRITGQSTPTTALFVGPAGAGKTLAAEVIARERGTVLHRIDLSRVASKYIGETEKNLERVFAAAERDAAVLLFCEADALFGKRPRGRDSHDRYASMAIGYLLMRLEGYGGVAILATNIRNNLDDAFTRRLRFIIQFPAPPRHRRSL